MKKRTDPCGKKAPRCVSVNTGAPLDYLTLWVVFYTGEPPEQVWPFQRDKSKSNKCHLSTGDKTEAVFIEAGLVSQLMQSIHHVVMTTFKRSINPGRRQYR